MPIAYPPAEHLLHQNSLNFSLGVISSGLFPDLTISGRHFFRGVKVQGHAPASVLCRIWGERIFKATG